MHDAFESRAWMKLKIIKLVKAAAIRSIIISQP